jgi:dihydroorotate dehydrogenase (fumarate)
MADLSTTYLGLRLKNPVVVGSCSLTARLAGVKEVAAAGAGAVVLKSIFEEEIAAEYESVLAEARAKGYNPASYDYYDYEIRGGRIASSVELVRQAKKAVSIPVIASINCTYSHEWASFARELENAGADALELNMFFLPSDLKRSSEEREAEYLRVVERVRAHTRLPIALKIGFYFTSLAQVIARLSRTGVAGLVLFNRFAGMDFDIEKLAVLPAAPLSQAADAGLSLRWIALTANRVSCDLAASTGVHDSDTLVKMILAGARAVQVVSALYRKGSGTIGTLLGGLEEWMGRRGFTALEGFRGKLSQTESEDPAAYERVQFMKHFGA